MADYAMETNRVKKNRTFFLCTLILGTTALGLAFSAPALKSGAKASKKKPSSGAQTIRTSQSKALKNPSKSAPAVKKMTVAESLGTPAPVLPESNARLPQSSGKAVVSKTKATPESSKIVTTVSTESIATSQASTVSAATIPTNTSSASAANQAPAGASAKKFGGAFTSTLTTSVVEDTASDKSVTTDFELEAWAAISKNWKVDAYTAISKDMRNDRDAKFQNANVGISHTPVSILGMGDQIKYRAKLTAILPTEQEAREVADFRGGLSLGNRFFFSPKATPAFSGYYQLSLGRNFHQYETTGLGEANQAYSIGHTLLTQVELGKFYLQFVPRITSRFTYQGTPSTRFEHITEIGAGLGAWSLGLGHTNSDNFYKANGQDSNLSLFDRDTSNYYFTASLAF